MKRPTAEILELSRDITRVMIVEKPRLEWVRHRAKVGEGFHVKLNAHAYSTIDGPVSYRERINRADHFRLGRTKGMSAAFLPAGHEIEATFQQDIEHSFLIIDEAYFKGFDDPRLKYCPEKFTYFAANHSPVGSALMRVMYNMIERDEIDEWPMLAENIARGIAAQIVLFFNRGTNLGKKDMRSHLTRYRQQRVLDYIEANISKQISLRDLAAIASLSPYHFGRQFSKTFKVTPIRFVWQRRIEHAKTRLLARVNESLTGIAIDCGFRSQSHFNDVFKRETGLTPSEYRAKS